MSCLNSLSGSAHIWTSYSWVLQGKVRVPVSFNHLEIAWQNPFLRNSMLPMKLLWSQEDSIIGTVVYESSILQSRNQFWKLTCRDPVKPNRRKYMCLEVELLLYFLFPCWSPVAFLCARPLGIQMACDGGSNVLFFINISTHALSHHLYSTKYGSARAHKWKKAVRIGNFFLDHTQANRTRFSVLGKV